jgi:hypothetical protein
VTIDSTFVENLPSFVTAAKKISHAFVDSHDDAWLRAHV